MNTSTITFLATVQLAVVLPNNEHARAQSGEVAKIWARHYASGLAPSFDVAVDLAIDRLGNLYVTGYSVIPGIGADYLTIKYDPEGRPIWIARYDGEGHKDDLPAAICVDEEGTVYVTGESVGTGTSSDYTTIKYNSDGVQEWVARYNGPANSVDEAVAMAR